MSARSQALIAGLAATAATLAGGSLLLRGPTVVEEVSVANPSEFDLHVEVSGGDGREGWLSITTVDSRSTSVAHDVIDQGELWVFRFSAQGRIGGERRIARADLRQAQWSLEVPVEVVDRLRQSGAPATP